MYIGLIVALSSIHGSTISYEQDPSLEVTLNYISERCGSFEYRGDGTMRDSMGVSISGDVVTIRHVDTILGYDFSSQFDINDVYFGVDFESGRISVQCLPAVMGNENCIRRLQGGVVNSAMIGCRERNRAQKAFEHFQVLKGGPRQNDDPFA